YGPSKVSAIISGEFAGPKTKTHSPVNSQAVGSFERPGIRSSSSASLRRGNANSRPRCHRKPFTHTHPSAHSSHATQIYPHIGPGANQVFDGSHHKNEKDAPNFEEIRAVARHEPLSIFSAPGEITGPRLRPKATASPPFRAARARAHHPCTVRFTAGAAAAGWTSARSAPGPGDRPAPPEVSRTRSSEGPPPLPSGQWHRSFGRRWSAVPAESRRNVNCHNRRWRYLPEFAALLPGTPPSRPWQPRR